MSYFISKEKRVLYLALFINMVSIGTLMMVMPLGADLVIYLNMKPEHIGYIAGGATFSSALVGFFIAPYLDRFDRRKLLIFFLSIRSLIIILCGFSSSQNELFFLFIVSALFSGPISGLSMASVVDVTSIKNRGRAMGFVASGFSLAAIIIVPMSLELSARFSWQASFYVFGSMGVMLAIACYLFFPQMIGHLVSKKLKQSNKSNIRSMVTAPMFITALACVSMAMFGHFLLVPNLSTFFQFNLGFPRDQIGLLYFFGGLSSLAAIRLCGQLIDKGFILQVLIGTSAIISIMIYIGFIAQVELPLYLIFVLFMAASTARTTSVTALTSRVPLPHQRAAFMSYQGALSGTSAAMASMVSSLYLFSDKNRQLVGMDKLAMLTILCTLLIPIVIKLLMIQYQKRQILDEENHCD